MLITPKITVITPTLNCGTYITRCIESVRSQGYPQVEHIIVDGGSTDNTRSILSQFPTLRWISEKDEGEAHALNKGIEMATGELLVWLNADDWLEPNAFRAVVEAYSKNPTAGVFYGKAHLVSEVTGQVSVKSPRPTIGMYELVRWWLTDTHPHQPAMYITRAALEKAGRFNHTLHYSIDFECWLRLADVASFSYVDATLASALIRRTCKSAGTEPEQVKSHWRVLLPFVAKLAARDRAAFWSDYFTHRFEAPLPFEETQLPIGDAVGWDGFLGFLRAPGESSLGQRFMALFPDPQRQEYVLDLIDSVAEIKRPPERKAVNIKVASDYDEGADLTQVSGESAFSRSIFEIFEKHRPRKIIETGTYRGLGTTAVIASTLQKLGISDPQFYTIEINPMLFREAESNLQRAGLASYVKQLLGLSVPRALLPTIEQIQQACVTNIEHDDIFIDYSESARAQSYFRETSVSGVPDDQLGRALAEFDNSPDFVLLDSGGHMGFVEFSYLLSKLKRPCIIALDDVNHIKHRKSFLLMKQDTRFSMLVEADEKFGFCIAQFQPSRASAALVVETSKTNNESPKVKLPRVVNRILWVRTDSIGDNVLASSTLEPIKKYYPNAEIAVVCRQSVSDLYQACPFVSKVITFSAPVSDAGVQALQRAVSSWGADLVLNTAFSRDTISDLIVALAAPAWSVGFAGDALNTQQGCDHLRKSYTHLLTGVDSWMPELKKYDFFLRQIGIEWPECKPVVWPGSDAEAWAEKELATLGVPKERLVAVLPGAVLPGRIYDQYAETLLALSEKGYVFIGVGSQADSELLRVASGGLQIQGFNLCGKTTLRQLAAVLSKVSIAIGAESGPAHMACAVGTPNVVVLGGGHFGRFMPYSPLTSAVSTPLACARCDWKCLYERVACVKDVDPLAVREAVLDRLKAPQVSRPQIYLSITRVARRSLRTYPMLAPDLSLYYEFGDVVTVTEQEGSTVRVTRPDQGEGETAVLTDSGAELLH
jgi:ADP-heptose:LPS heptosyltransferase